MLDRFFDMENPLMQGLQTVAYLMILNVMTILFSIPVVTAGAALTALFDVLRAIARQEETYPVRMFVRSFKKNLAQGVLMGLIFTFAGICIMLHYVLAASLMPVLRFVSLALAYLLIALTAYAFPLLARFKNTIFGTLKNAFLLMAGYFPRTFLVTACVVAFYVLIIRYPTFCAPLVFMFGISLPCHIEAVALDPVLRTMESNNHAEGKQ